MRCSRKCATRKGIFLTWATDCFQPLAWRISKRSWNRFTPRKASRTEKPSEKTSTNPEYDPSRLRSTARPEVQSAWSSLYLVPTCHQVHYFVLERNLDGANC